MQRDDDDNMTENMTFRYSADQRERWEKAAARDRRTLSDWIRLALDNAERNERAIPRKGRA